MKAKAVIFLFIISCLYTLINRKGWQEDPFVADRSGYYAYLPAIFLHDDLESFSYLKQVKGPQADDIPWFLFEQEQTGRTLNKYAVGTALFELPFFAIAHLYCKLSAGGPCDGYAPPYRLLILLSSIFWSALGLEVLRRTLKHFASDAAVAITLACIGLGTNLFYYSAWEQGMSHPISFFLFASVLFLSWKFHTYQRPREIYLLGLVLGLVILVRPTNIAISVVPLLWNVTSLQSFRQKLGDLCQHIRHIIPATLIAFLIFLIQMTYWKYASGQWLYFSYQGEYFEFLNPQIQKGLFSFRKGWFIYTPIAFFGVTGIFFLYRHHRNVFLSVLVSLALIVYIVFSWNNWWYGGSFGARSMIDYLAILSLPLAVLIHSLLNSRFPIIRLGLSMVLSALVLLNIFQSYQYSVHIIHYDRMTREYYLHVFGKTELNREEAEKLLMNDKDYWAEFSK